MNNRELREELYEKSLKNKNAMPETYKKFGIKCSKIASGLSIGACLSYDKYFGECYLFLNLIKVEICIGWLSFEKENEE